MDKYYEWIKVFHIVFMTAWMAGLFYLPRLFAYHSTVKKNDKEMYDKFSLMERRLLRIIMNPAMIMTLVLGVLLANIYGFWALGPWFHLKMLFVGVLMVQHMYWARCRKMFVEHKNTNSESFYKLWGEITTVFFIGIIIVVIIKPF